jgi:ABC-type transporter Mla subunit MlaD
MMMKASLAAVAAAVLALTAMPAAASDHLNPNGPTFNEVVASYAGTATRAGRDRETRVIRQLAALENLCAKTDARSVRRCEESWTAIHRAHAKLQAQRAAAIPGS